MALKYMKLKAHPSEMADKELREVLSDALDSRVIRSLLMAELAAIRAGAEREERTLRNVWYDVIKPALSRAGILNQKTRTGKELAWPHKLSTGLAEMVRMGVTTYEELRIIDGSRQRQVATTIVKFLVDVPLVGAHFPWVILFTEKDTIWGVVQDLASLYGVSAISGGGEPSNACTENTIRAIARSDAFKAEQPERIVLLSLTDYDPFGYTIANAQLVQIQEAVDGLSAERGKLAQVQSLRIGLEPDQLTPEERAIKAYEPKDQGLAEWYAQTGGVDGQPLGLELDALPLSRLRRMFAEAIGQVIDLDERRYDLQDAFVDLIACELLRPDFDEKRRKLIAAISDAPLWQEIEQTPIPDSLFERAAVAGQNSIDPLRASLFDCAGQVRAAMRKALEAL
jgi:hypothetical protein